MLPNSAEALQQGDTACNLDHEAPVRRPCKAHAGPPPTCTQLRPWGPEAGPSPQHTQRFWTIRGVHPEGPPFFWSCHLLGAKLKIAHQHTVLNAVDDLVPRVACDRHEAAPGCAVQAHRGQLGGIFVRPPVLLLLLSHLRQAVASRGSEEYNGSSVRNNSP